MDMIKDWFSGLMLAGAVAAAPMAWRFATAWAAKKAGELLVKMVDKALEAGDRDVDAIIYAIAAKVESEISDDISADNEKVKGWAKKLCEGQKFYGILAGREKEIAYALAAVLKQLDRRAKEYATRKAEEGTTPPGES